MKEQKNSIAMSEKTVDLVVKGDVVLQGQTVKNGSLAIDGGKVKGDSRPARARQVYNRLTRSK